MLFILPIAITVYMTRSFSRVEEPIWFMAGGHSPFGEEDMVEGLRLTKGTCSYPDKLFAFALPRNF